MVVVVSEIGVCQQLARSIRKKQKLQEPHYEACK